MHMSKVIISIIVATLVLGVLIWIARPDSQKTTASSAKSTGSLIITEETDTYDFGTISMAAGNVAHQFKIKNIGSERITIHKLYTSCMCTTATLTAGGNRFGPYGMPGHGAIPRIEQAINPGEEAAVEIVFDPAAHGPAGVGPIQRTITLETDAEEPVLLQFTALVTP